MSPGWKVTDAMVEEFRDYLGEQRVTIDEAAFKTDLTFIKAMIRFEVDVDLFGVEEARRNLSRVDPAGAGGARLLRRGQGPPGDALTAGRTRPRRGYQASRIRRLLRPTSCAGVSCCPAKWCLLD